MRLPTLGCCRSRMEGIMGAPTKSARETVISGRVTPEVSPMLTQFPTFGDSRLPARFWAKVRIGSVPAHRPDLGPCWEWTGACDRQGYGRFSTGSHGDNSQRPTLAHRLAYETLVAAIPEGLEPDNLCRKRSCVRSSHIEPVTHLENVRRGNAAAGIARKTHCPQGHRYDAANIYRSPGHPNHRHCRTCERLRLRLRD